jgi:hypothetical protein
MKAKALGRTIRRSAALPRDLVEEVMAVAPGPLRQNLNRLVTVALQEFAARRRAKSFEETMARMAADPAIRAECGTIARELATTEGDGLGRDSCGISEVAHCR